MSVSFGSFELKNPLVAASSPLTESPPRLRCCHTAGFGAAILKTASPYIRTGTGYGRRVIYIGEDCYADSSFEREILTLEEGVALYRQAKAFTGDMLLIPSVSVNSLEAEQWIAACGAFEQEGAKLIQLDFFYLGTIMDSPGFDAGLSELLAVLTASVHCAIMPKLNIHFDPRRICELLVRYGVSYVSLLDSIREKAPKEYGLHDETTSCFGRRQLPVTRQYLAAATEQGLHICAGGGITAPEDGLLLRTEGAALIQTASYVLRRGFSGVHELLATLDPASMDSPEPNPPHLSHRTWCDVEDGAPCERCGACVRV